MGVNLCLNPVSEILIGDFFVQAARPEEGYSQRLEAGLRDGIQRLAWERGLSDLDQQWLKSGTEVQVEQPIPFTFNEWGITFYFAPYTVAAYAFGTWEVTIPFYYLRDILNPEGPQKLA